MIQRRRITKYWINSTQDAESGQLKWVDTSNPSVRESYQSYSRNRSQHSQQLFKNSGVRIPAFQTDQDYIKPLIRFFKKRNR